MQPRQHKPLQVSFMLPHVKLLIQPIPIRTYLIWTRLVTSEGEGHFKYRDQSYKSSFEGFHCTLKAFKSEMLNFVSLS